MLRSSLDFFGRIAIGALWFKLIMLFHTSNLWFLVFSGEKECFGPYFILILPKSPICLPTTLSTRLLFKQTKTHPSTNLVFDLTDPSTKLFIDLPKNKLVLDPPINLVIYLHTNLVLDLPTILLLDLPLICVIDLRTNWVTHLVARLPISLPKLSISFLS